MVVFFKMSYDVEYTFTQRQHRKNQQVRKELLRKMHLHTFWGGCSPQTEMMWGQGSLCLVGGAAQSSSVCKNSMEIPKN